MSVALESGVRGGSGGKVCIYFFELGGLVGGGDLSVLPFKEIDVQYVCSHDIFV